MKKFKSNKIREEREEISKLLKEARERKGVNLQEASQSLKIKLDYLKAIESGSFEKLPVGVYTRSFLREYATFLDLESKKVLDDYKKLGENQLLQKQNIFSSKTVSKFNFLVFPKIFKNFLLVLIIASCFIYLGYSVKEVLTPPFLEITEPTTDIVIENYSTTVIGRADEGAQVFINGDLVFLDDGFFSKKINLKKGSNTIVITAKKRYGRDNVAERHVLVK